MSDGQSPSPGPGKEGFKLYNYDPSLPAAIIFTIIFAASSFVHIYQMVRHRTWYFVPFIIGALFEAVGYAGRAMSAVEAPDFTKTPFIIQVILLLLGPALYAASVYMVLGRLAVALDASHLSIIRPSWMTKVFVTGDVLSFLAQSGGGAMLVGANTPSEQDRAENVILIGLGIQVLFFGFFMVATVLFHMRIRKTPTTTALRLQAPWEGLVQVLYAVSLCIMVRSIFRVAEYVLGHDGVLQSNEVYIYLFDALLMAAVSVLFNWFHPSRVIGREMTAKNISDEEIVLPGRN